MSLAGPCCFNGKASEHIDAAPVAVMLAIDRQKIDRRVLLEADSLEAAGWNVTIIGMPMDPGDEEIDPRVIRVTTGAKSAAREARILPIYRWIRQLLPMNATFNAADESVCLARYGRPGKFLCAALREETLSQASALTYSSRTICRCCRLARRAADRCGAKVIYDSHELYSEQEFTGWEKRRWVEIETKYIRHCDRIVTTNPAVVAEFGQTATASRISILFITPSGSSIFPNCKNYFIRFSICRKIQLKIPLYQGGLSANRHLEVLVTMHGVTCA